MSLTESWEYTNANLALVGEGEQDSTPIVLTLPGSLPQQVRIVDTRNGEEVFNSEIEQQELDLSFLSPGDYVLYSITQSGASESLSLTVNASSVATQPTWLTLDGAIPRRVQISSATSGELISDYWIYGSQLNVVSLLPEGSYRIQHAAPGENWQAGNLKVGARIPSYRLYAELRDDGSLRVDWGHLGSHGSAQLAISSEGTVIVDQEVEQDQIVVNVPPGVIDVQLVIAEQEPIQLMLGTRLVSASTIALPFNVPRAVQIIDTATGQVAFDQVITETSLDLSFLVPGNYLLMYADGSKNGTLTIARDLQGVHLGSSALTLDGQLPRRLKILDNLTGAMVSDYWVYGSTLDIVGLLPLGVYTVQHAASGENWRDGVLTIGAKLPSYRLYAELQTEQSARIDWGSLGSYDAAHILIKQDGTVVAEHDGTGDSIQVPVPAGRTEVEVQLSGLPPVVIRIGQAAAETTQPEAESLANFFLPLPNSLPRFIRVIDTSTGVVVFDGETDHATFDMNFLPPGDYLVQHASLGEPLSSIGASLGNAGIILSDVGLTLDGPLPRRVRITDVESSQVLVDHWIYGSWIGVVDLLPEGNYTVQHASSGENWRFGELQVGAFLPSYRLYTERQEDGSVRVNWGSLGYHDNVRLRGLQESEVFLDATIEGIQAIVTAPAGTVDFQVILNSEPEVRFVSRTVELNGTLPRQVRVFDPLSGETVLETLQTTKILDLSTIPFGNFLVQHWASGSLSRYVAVANSATLFEAFDPSVTFEGILPRRLIFTNALTNLIVWDSWIYGSTVNVLGLLPPGEYKVRHASSGQPYQQGRLVVGAPLPSYRLYTEQVSPNAIKIDWGPLGSELSARIQVFEDSQLILDVTQKDSPAVLDVPQGDLTVRVTVADHVQSVRHCSLPQLAQDGTCRSFSQNLYFSFVSNSMFGFSVPGAVPTNPEVTAEIVLVEPPLNGTLVGGDEARFQTYIPHPDFAGSDSAVLRVAFSDGTQTDVLVTFNTALPGVPVFAHFVPGIGTTQPDYRTPPPAVLAGSGLPYDLIVNSDFGKVVERINRDGSTAWRHIQPSPMGTVAVLDEEVFVAGMRVIRVLDAETGILKRSIPVELAANEVLQFANPLDSQRFLVSWFNDSDLSYVGIWHVNHGWEWISAQTYLWPRWADLQEDIMVIADTYGHRIVGESITGGNIVFEIPAFFPNDVRWTGKSSVLIVEEHADRVWVYDWSTEERELVISAPGSRSDLYLPFDVVVDLSNSADLRIIPSSRTSLSKSSTEFSGTDTVYAPNGAVQLPDGSYYIADTDNHRVIHVSRDGNVLSELTGLNNPTKIAYLWDPPPPVVNPPIPIAGMG